MTAAGLGVGSQSFSVTVGELVAEQARSAPDQVALEEAGRTWSYRELDDRVARLAGVLLTYGVRHGDRVAVLAENRHEYLELELAAGRLGAITACLNWRLLPAELEHCIRLVEPSLVVVSPRFRPALAVVAHGVRHVVLLGALWRATPPPVSEAEPHRD